MTPWLEAWAETGISPEAAQRAFDGLPPVSPEAMFGAWRGSELPTGHPLDGLLALYGWRGKRFTDVDTVDPLLFDHHGAAVAVHPGRLPLGVALVLPRIARTEAARALFQLVLPLLTTRGPRARLRMVEQAGQISAAMVYDDLPIIDHFRRVDETRLLGLMDLRSTSRPFFFLLTREAAAPEAAV